MTLVSAIVPSYNHARYLRERLESVLGQGHRALEAILLDDASNDGSAEILREYAAHPRVAHVEIAATNSGSPFRQWQAGLARARGELVWIAESDDTADPGLLEALVPAFDDPTVVLAYCDSRVVDEHGTVLSGHNDWPDALDPVRWRADHVADGAEELRRFLRYRNVVSSASAAVFRRSVVTASFDFPLRFRSAGDWYFWAQVASGGRVAYRARALSSWRVHPETTRTPGTLEKDVARLREVNEVIRRIEALPVLRGCPADPRGYEWILTWWLSRYSYRNLARLPYAFPTLPPRLLPRFYRLLALRTLRELRGSAYRWLHA